MPWFPSLWRLAYFLKFDFVFYIENISSFDKAAPAMKPTSILARLPRYLGACALAALAALAVAPLAPAQAQTPLPAGLGAAEVRQYLSGLPSDALRQQASWLAPALLRPYLSGLTDAQLRQYVQALTPGQITQGLAALTPAQRARLQREFERQARRQVQQAVRAEVAARSARAVAMGQSASMLLLDAEMGTLAQRQGDLRRGHDEGAFWARGSANRFKVDTPDTPAFDLRVEYLTLGADHGWRLDTGRLYLGAYAGVSRARMDDNDIMHGRIESRFLGTYLTYVDNGGFYVDAVSKLGRIDESVSFDLPLGLGDYDDDISHTTYTGSAEAGYHFKLPQRWFVEPQAQVIYSRSSQTSVQGRAGVRAGRDFTLAGGATLRPYVSASYLHEFSHDDSVDFGGKSYDAELPGSRWQLGAGAALDVGAHRAYADLRYGHGANISQDLSLNIGYAYRF
ncbi:autotransporter Phg [Bordetella pertussis I036]|nr:autotransporter Phg [Bordetella pertussis 2250905]ETH03083.1 autotransporter Phg [Bordetella pertussis 2356847]ETH08441.1 autotransporter Phg [Bordetella pertussis 2371640]ETH10906.1 autotransporter Phg [Bordetella pertussis STO1-SEAT-0006]ETH21459.1 autotransporter Phg [Bordetella pertussis CHLA-13]ETH23458.1 autotransporter Phg [Bordetella pertussis CHLA-15]ETH28406.1 autotransporter Phg [Bordetella pertussis CHLA-20]ETH32496.1 autotransporter Phg [Bordetella pertussis CHLA-26]ETH35482